MVLLVAFNATIHTTIQWYPQFEFTPNIYLHCRNNNSTTDGNYHGDSSPQTFHSSNVYRMLWSSCDTFCFSALTRDLSACFAYVWENVWTLFPTYRGKTPSSQQPSIAYIQIHCTEANNNNNINWLYCAETKMQILGIHFCVNTVCVYVQWFVTIHNIQKCICIIITSKKILFIFPCEGGGKYVSAHSQSI